MYTAPVLPLPTNLRPMISSLFLKTDSQDIQPTLGPKTGPHWTSSGKRPRQPMLPRRHRLPRRTPRLRLLRPSVYPYASQLTIADASLFLSTSAFFLSFVSRSSNCFFPTSSSHRFLLAYNYHRLTPGTRRCRSNSHRLLLRLSPQSAGTGSRPPGPPFTEPQTAPGPAAVSSRHLLRPSTDQYNARCLLISRRALHRPAQPRCPQASATTNATRSCHPR